LNLLHVVWATAQRRRLLRPEFDPVLLAILGRRAHDLDCMLLAGGCASDHLHTLLRLSPAVRLCDVVNRLKGGSAYDVNHHHGHEHPPIRWQAGYWAESVSPADVNPLVDYLGAQRTHHDSSHPAERWQFADEEEGA
jgi:REP element-mobilizing transposase RayT